MAATTRTIYFLCCEIPDDGAMFNYDADGWLVSGGDEFQTGETKTCDHIRADFKRTDQGDTFLFEFSTIEEECDGAMCQYNKGSIVVNKTLPLDEKSIVQYTSRNKYWEYSHHAKDIISILHRSNL